MALTTKNLSVLAYANGFTLWHYVTTDAAAEVMTAPAYFAGASDLLRGGDVVIVNSAGAGCIVMVTASSFTDGVTVSALGAVVGASPVPAAPANAA